MPVAALRRSLSVVAVLALAPALPCAARLAVAHAAPASNTANLLLGLRGPQDVFVGQIATYTLTVTADPAGADAGPLEYSVAFPRANVALVSFANSAATCADFTSNLDVGVICEQNALAAGASVSLQVTVDFTAVSNGALFPAQAKAANSAFSYTDGGAKIVPQPQPTPPGRVLPPGAIFTPIGPALPGSLG